MDKYDTFWPRFFALIIDGILIKFLIYFLSLIRWAGSYHFSSLIAMIQLLLPYVYSVLMVGNWGQTAGKMLMRVQVVDNKTESKIGYLQSLMRELIPLALTVILIISAEEIQGGFDLTTDYITTFGYIVFYFPSIMLLFWSFTEIITMLFNRKNRALHDLVARTVVIRTNLIEKDR